MDRRGAFNEEVEKYDLFRPVYCRDLFDSVIAYAGLDTSKAAVEVGLGTGQATQPILRTGCKVEAIEVGTDLANFAESKFKEYSNFSIQNIAFEDSVYEEESVDLVYSGTAFHWIPEDLGYSKVHRMLKPGGSIALFWNRPSISAKNGQMFEEIQTAYAKAGFDDPKDCRDRQQIYESIMDSLDRHGFVDREFKLFHRTRELTAEDYIALLDTYSDHRTLERKKRERLYDEIRSAISKQGGTIILDDVMDLHLARKP